MHITVELEYCIQNTPFFCIRTHIVFMNSGLTDYGYCSQKRKPGYIDSFFFVFKLKQFQLITIFLHLKDCVQSYTRNFFNPL